MNVRWAAPSRHVFGDAWTPDPVFQAVSDFSCLPCPARGSDTFLLYVEVLDPLNAQVEPPEEFDAESCRNVDLDARRWFLQDPERSVYALANSTGIVVEGYAYNPYGEAIVYKHSGNEVTFTATDSQGSAASASTELLYTARRFDAESEFGVVLLELWRRSC